WGRRWELVGERGHTLVVAGADLKTSAEGQHGAIRSGVVHVNQAGRERSDSIPMNGPRDDFGTCRKIPSYQLKRVIPTETSGRQVGRNGFHHSRAVRLWRSGGVAFHKLHVAVRLH